MLTKVLKYSFAVANSPNHTKIAIIGGGSAGANLTGHLRKLEYIYFYKSFIFRVFKDEDIRVFEPSQTHNY